MWPMDRRAFFCAARALRIRCSVLADSRDLDWDFERARMGSWGLVWLSVVWGEYGAGVGF